MSVYLGEKLISGTSSKAVNFDRIGQIIQSTIPLTDAGLHLLDGALIQGSGSYSAFVDYIAGLTSDYPDLFDTEANWQQSVTNYGVCGKFVYDSVNNTVRLPKITGIVEGTTDLTALGDLVQAGLPNITGGFYAYSFGNGGCSQAFAGSISNSNQLVKGTSSDFNYDTFNFNASRSNSIYGNSSTVQPQTIKVLYYIVVATSTKTDIQVDIDEIATDLNGKADVDFSNIADTAKIYIAHASSPSSTYETLTWGANGTTYTAPADGWFIAQARFTGAIGTHYLLLTTANIANMSSRCGAYNASAATTMTDQVNLPVRKGATVYLNYGSTSGQTMDSNYIRFIYAIGSESEAS